MFALEKQSSIIMKLFELQTLVSFGKYHGLTLQSIIMQDSSYVNWCLHILDHFNLSQEAYSYFCKKNSKYATVEFRDIWHKKNNLFAKTCKRQDLKCNSVATRFHYYDKYGKSGEIYGWYNGWSDDVINDAFEGDLENTWNVD